ncbi:suppressor of cytokine signaling 1-like [Salarias fasciatus]|uniref:Suppressor of cytokine signaling 1-like n=1 Tax=Salarias fasciatus TaxID=181472 RepID=A0A672GVU3_SALFA|nr:suppressor of cytokine signaling 1-like [Salarias fasciatus]
MVRDNLSGAEVQSQKETEAAETAPEEPAGPTEQPLNSARGQPESREPTERQLNLLLWSKLQLGEELKSSDEPGAEADGLPSHIRPFSSAEEYRLVKRTYQQLQHGGYYWGPMTMEDAHAALSGAPLGTFLIRDSGQSDVFFTLSYQSDDGPTSVRVQLKDLRFNLWGSQKTFASFFALLTHYTRSSCKLTVPYRRQRPERLKQMCRRALIRTHGAENISTLPGLSTQIKDYVCDYPHCI